MVEKIGEACDARDRLTQGNFTVCARTNARSVTDLDDAIERGIAYAKAGADMLFPEGLKGLNEFQQFADEVSKHV